MVEWVLRRKVVIKDCYGMSIVKKGAWHQAENLENLRETVVEKLPEKHSPYGADSVH
jgi:endonuclease III-like uncharacterized protein